MVEDAARYPGDNQTDARFALVLLYNRERRYDEALKQLASLRERYPRNRLCLAGSRVDEPARRPPADAERMLTEGIDAFADRCAAANVRRRCAVALQARRGARRAGQRRRGATQSGAGPPSRRRGPGCTPDHLELGKLALKAGRAADARKAWQSTIALCEREQDEATADEARRLLKRLQ